MGGMPHKPLDGQQEAGSGRGPRKSLGDSGTRPAPQFATEKRTVAWRTIVRHHERGPVP